MVKCPKPAVAGTLRRHIFSSDKRREGAGKRHSEYERRLETGGRSYRFTELGVRSRTISVCLNETLLFRTMGLANRQSSSSHARVNQVKR
jgi:hypothetical protein